MVHDRDEEVRRTSRATGSSPRSPVPEYVAGESADITRHQGRSPYGLRAREYPHGSAIHAQARKSTRTMMSRKRGRMTPTRATKAVNGTVKGIPRVRGSTRNVERTRASIQARKKVQHNADLRAEAGPEDRRRGSGVDEFFFVGSSGSDDVEEFEGLEIRQLEGDSTGLRRRSCVSRPRGGSRTREVDSRCGSSIFIDAIGNRAASISSPSTSTKLPPSLSCPYAQRTPLSDLVHHTTTPEPSLLPASRSAWNLRRVARDSKQHNSIKCAGAHDDGKALMGPAPGGMSVSWTYAGAGGASTLATAPSYPVGCQDRSFLASSGCYSFSRVSKVSAMPGISCVASPDPATHRYFSLVQLPATVPIPPPALVFSSSLTIPRPGSINISL
ncbi:hypothetical protein B0H17DRAFT_1135887 [Mycena rosella]|uniref:Uncharacterized protein n=1 Tax=Mycena rosella TaxID=1033263 RepID=A0AAD7GHC9_MYCRO|nr:hypothetical protein B0H17DRAFT_1135887 [Mycena rosella]